MLSPVPPSTFGISLSTFSKSPRVPQQQQQNAGMMNSSTNWEQRKAALASSTTGERKVEMYAEDRKGAIERFTSRLLEIIDDSPQNQAKHSPTKKFSSSPTSLAGGGGISPEVAGSYRHRCEGRKGRPQVPPQLRPHGKKCRLSG